MSDTCIIPNPDIYGIGVRIAIYAQNFLAFPTAVIYLWDRQVTRDETMATEGQSIAMLSIAFALLISTIIGAQGPLNTPAITRFDAAVILDLSWMNNTSTFVWFLLYAHNRSRPERGQDFVPATWSAWTKTLLSPLNRVVTGKSKARCGRDDGKASTRITRLPRIVHRFRNHFSPVLALGSIHLSLMSAIGIWLWSNPSRFGAPITCYPFLYVLGVAVPISSRALQIVSLFLYALLLVPGFNLLLPSLFFLSPHIMYNKFRRRFHRFWTPYKDVPHTSRRTGCLLHQERDLEAYACDKQNPEPPGIPSDHHEDTRSSYTAFLVIGLLFLVAVDIIFLIDIEQTLTRNPRVSQGERLWGFGQILPLLLLVLPLRDVMRSIVNIHQQSQMDLQKQFEESLRQAIMDNSFEGHNFQNLIDRGADLDTQIEGNDLELVSLLQFAVYKRNEELVQYLLDRGANQNISVGGNPSEARRGKRLHDHCWLLGRRRSTTW